jgi:hypothetical protein
VIELNVNPVDSAGQPVPHPIVTLFMYDRDNKQAPMEPRIRNQTNFYVATTPYAPFGFHAPFTLYGTATGPGLGTSYFGPLQWDGLSTLNIPVTLSFKQPPSPPWGIPSDAPFRGAFCIPNALPGIPFGDGKRIWTPAFGCYTGTPWQDAMIGQTKSRHYTWFEYQVSGWPYRQDYPELAVDPQRTYTDLMKLKQAGLATIIAFDDTRLDLSYLHPVAAATQGLVDCVMGIYELNGVVSDNEDDVARILEQQHQLWPKALNAFHSTTQDNGGKGFGERPFWQRVAPFVDVYFLQQSAFNHTLPDTANRASDFSPRLQGPHAGWVQLRRGMVLFEETTSATYRTKPEAYGVQTTDQLMGMITPRPAGYMDGGSVTP